ncbi:hypothetical protein Celaphus_00016688, partial [Cervus elaphus hippelaphus]
MKREKLGQSPASAWRTAPLSGHELRAQGGRAEGGRALTLSSPEVRFHMDSETHDPIDLQTKELRETNSMVEEFMLLANISVAKKIHEEFSEHALLRKHPAPPPSNYEILVKAAKSKVQGENSNDRNDRAIRVAAKWYNEHLKKMPAENQLQVIFITNDRKNKEKAAEEGIPAFTCEEYIKSLTANPELIDRLACLSEEGNEIESGKTIFSEHLPLSKLQQGIKSGTYLQGTFRASRENYLEATIILQGLKNLNRAIHEDIVAVELLPRHQWVAPSSVVLQDEGQNEDDIEKEEERERILKTAVNEKMLKPTGRVVGIIKRNWRPYCGMLSKSDIKEGHFVKNLGEVGDKETETEVLLLEHDVPHQAFSQAVLSFLPKMPWSITEKDMKNREDLRHLCVCSVDPPGCTDIDDALHCRELENGNLEVGVHIADVSHFIRPGNALDQESARRGTTVYLCEKIPSLKIEDTVFHVFDKVKVKIMLDSSNLQHQKIRMSLVEPQVVSSAISMGSTISTVLFSFSLSTSCSSSSSFSEAPDWLWVMDMAVTTKRAPREVSPPNCGRGTPARPEAGEEASVEGTAAWSSSSSPGASRVKGTRIRE